MSWLVIILLFVPVAVTISYLNVLFEYYRKVKVIASKPIISKKNNENDNIKVEEQIFNQAPGPIPWPILGNLALLGQYEVPFEGFTDLSKKFGDAYTLTLGTTRCLVVNNLDLIRDVLNQNGRYLGGRPDFIRYHKLFGGDRNNSLALCDWSSLQQKRRNLARKHCSPRDFSSLYSKMSDVGTAEMNEFMFELKNQIIDGKPYYVKPLIMQTCANMFSQYMCSTRFDYNDKEFEKITRNFDEIFWEINQGYALDFLPWLQPFYSKHLTKLANWTTEIRDFILKRIVDERELHISLDEPEKDFTDALLKSLIDDSSVTRDTIIYMLEDFLGGHSAIGNLVIMALGYIAKNEDIKKLVQNEIDTVTNNGKIKITLRDTEKMPYTVATIYEVLRYASSPIVPHVATEDAFIAGYGVTKGTIVFINNYALNTSEKYWDEPQKFNPGRFLEEIPFDSKNQSRKISESSDSGIESEQSLKHRRTEKLFRIKKNIPHFLPFSIGKRTCIGQNLVRSFSFLMLSNILQTYDVSSNNFAEIITHPACVAVPPDTYPLIFTPRITTIDVQS